MKRFVLTALGAMIGFVAIVSDADAQKRTLNIAVAGVDAGKLDPHQTTLGVDAGLLNWIFNALVRIKPGQASPEFIEPDLAESWTSNPAGTDWIFKLRKNVQCHGGFGEFTAEDAEYSLKRAANKATSSFASDYAAFDKIEATDRYTLHVQLKNAVPSLLGLLANYHGGMMVCKKAAETMGDGFAKKPIGTGPFMFADYQPQQFVKLAANKQYFRGVPQLDEIVYRYIPSDATRDLAFRSGEIDMLFGQQTDAWVKRMRDLPGTRIAALEPAELNSLYLNVKAKPLDDIRVRQAIAAALDRKAMVRFMGTEVSSEAVSVIPRSNLGAVPLALASYDVAKAKQLLTDAGYPNGVTVKSVQTTFPALLRIMQAVQGQLREAGINVELETVDHPTWHAQIRKDLSPLTLYQAARFPVADVYLTQFFYSPSTVATPTAVTNFSHCAVADAEIVAARTEPDLAKQKALWRMAQEKILREVCAVPMIETPNIWAWRDTLDFGYDMVGSLNLTPHITEKTRFTH